MNALRPRLVVSNQSTSETKVNSNRGASELREAVNLVLEQESMEIAEALGRNAKSGKIQSIQFMYAVAKDKEKAGEASHAGEFSSSVLAWVNSPEWKGDPQRREPGEKDDEE
jgi:hypothetical protein